MLPSEFTKMCRVCMKPESKYSIYEHNVKLEDLEITGSVTTIKDMRSKIMTCSSVNIIDGDMLPEKICDGCAHSLDVAYNFKILCEETDVILRKLLKEYYETSQDCDLAIDPGIDLKIEPKDEFLTEPDHEVEVDSFENVNYSKKIKKKSKTLRNSIATGKKCNKRYNCQNCKQSFNARSLLLKHSNRLLGSKHLASKCYGCGVIFSSMCLRSQHEQTCIACLEYSCQHCSMKISGRKMYECHLKTHVKTEEKQNIVYQCGTCQKIFKTRSNLVQHSHIHKTKREHVCEICGRAFNRRDYLLTHIPTHTGVKKHQCPHCNFRSAQKSSLNVHLRVHTGERPYTCDTCGQKCINSSNLLAHKRRHDGVKKFKCKLCEKLFAYKASLEEHVSSTHAGLKEHICHFCGAAYSRKRGLQRHTRQKHLVDRSNGSVAIVNGGLEQMDNDDR